MPVEYLPYYADWRQPNIVVDSAPRAGTRITLSHWPSTPSPQHLSADSSSEIAINYLRDRNSHVEARAVTASHYDVDALISLFALIQPDEVLREPGYWIDLAEAGDFEIARFAETRKLARALEFWSDTELSPIADELRGETVERRHQIVFEDLLPKLTLLKRLPRHLEGRWRKGEECYQATRTLLNDGKTEIRHCQELDLTTISTAELPAGFEPLSSSYLGLDPFAVHEAAKGFCVAVSAGGFRCVVQRYESWVQYSSRPFCKRRDLSSLALFFASLDDVAWHYPGVQFVAPCLSPQDAAASSIAPKVFFEHVISFLQQAPPAWHPSAGEVSTSRESP